MTIAVTDTLVAGDGSTFPVVDAPSVKGVPQVFADTTARDAFPAEKLTVGQLVRTLADGGQDWRVTAVSPTVTFDEIVPPAAAEWGSIGGSIASQTDLITLLGGLDTDITAVEQSVATLGQDVADLEALAARNGVTTAISDTFDVNFGLTGKALVVRVVAGPVTIGGVGYTFGNDVTVYLLNTSGSTQPITVTPPWLWVDGDEIVEILDGQTLLISTLSGEDAATTIAAWAPAEVPA